MAKKSNINSSNDFRKPQTALGSFSVVFDPRHLIVYHKPFIIIFYPAWKGSTYCCKAIFYQTENINLFSVLSQYVFWGKPNDVKLIAVVWKLLFDPLYYILLLLLVPKSASLHFSLFTAYRHAQSHGPMFFLSQPA